MRILIFGAGASMPAGYPSAGELIPAVDQFVKEYSEWNLKESWRRWHTWRTKSDFLKRIVFNPNPEVVLSLADLYEAASRASDEAEMHQALEKERSGDLTEEELRKYQEYWKSEERKRLDEARPARIGFLECLQRFFFYRHHLDASNCGRRQRDYLHRHFARLSKGDTVITLNWDTTVERTLAEKDSGILLAAMDSRRICERCRARNHYRLTLIRSPK